MEVVNGPQPPDSAAARERHWVADHTPESRDITPAVGTPGEPAPWERAGPGVALHVGEWRDGAWSYLFNADTRYAAAEADADAVAAANRRMRSAEMPTPHGPFINAPVWTWEVPLYFWFGGVASGSSFVALACDLAGDHRSARIARKVALAAVMPSPPLLIADLGRPARFLNMLRIFKPRSPMNLGAWALMTFSALDAAAVAADTIKLPWLARALGAGTAVVGGYLGSYTGVLLATTAVPVWARSRLFLGPIFVSTAAATGAAATRLTLTAAGLPDEHPTRKALGTVETGAMFTELALSAINERRLGHAAPALEHGRLFAAAKWLVRGGLALRLVRHPRAADASSVCFLAGGLAFRYAWVGVGRVSAQDHESVARMARGTPRKRLVSKTRRPLPLPGRGLYPEVVRRTSLLAERLLRR